MVGVCFHFLFDFLFDLSFLSFAFGFDFSAALLPLLRLRGGLAVRFGAFTFCFFGFGSSLPTNRFLFFVCSSLYACLASSYCLYSEVFWYLARVARYFFFAFSAFSWNGFFSLSDMFFHSSPTAFEVVPMSASGWAFA